MPYIEVSEKTYLEFRNFVAKLQPFASKFGQKVTDDGAMVEAIVAADQLWSHKDYVNARLKEVGKELADAKRKFKSERR